MPLAMFVCYIYTCIFIHVGNIDALIKGQIPRYLHFSFILGMLDRCQAWTTCIKRLFIFVFIGGKVSGNIKKVRESKHLKGLKIK